MYVPVLSYPNESHKSNAVSERCFCKTAVLQNHELQNSCGCNVEKILVAK